MGLLVARDITVAPPGTPDPVVRGVSIQIDAGEWLALDGANGSGKTTLALALAGLWPVRSGTLTFQGLPLQPGGREGRAALAVLFQDPSTQVLKPTVADEMAFAARNLDVSESEVCARVGLWAERLGVQDRLNRDPATLSAGERQLVLFAAAMVASPRLLIADEAGAHFDRHARDRVLAVLNREVGRGLGVLWITQDPLERSAAQRVIGLRLSGTWHEIRAGAREAPPVIRFDGAARPCRTVEGDPWRIRIEPGDAAIRIGSAIEMAVAPKGPVAVLGPNGSGKSRLLLALAGIEPLAQVQFPCNRPEADSPILASQFPEEQIFHELAGDELIYAAVQRGRPAAEAQAIAVQYLAAMGVEPDRFLQRRCWTLSSGERRVLSVLSAVVAPSSLVLLDEPTAGLDPERRRRLAALLDGLAEGVSTVVATQDADWVSALGWQEVHLGETEGSGPSKSQQKNGLTEPCPPA